MVGGVSTTVIQPQEVIGGCRILDFLGRGGMGEVYLAEHLTLEKLVAVKVLPPDKIKPQYIKRFVKEAQLCSRIEHPNVVTIYNVGEERGLHFIVMQYVEGRNLVEVVCDHVRDQGGPLPWKTALRIFRLAAKGVGAVHKANLIHRDIKPANIMFASDSRVLLMDFGLVREEKADMSQAGTLVGTPAYMSPEQCLGRELDRRSDIFSLGSTLYYLLTARRPYPSDVPIEVIVEIAQGKTPPPASSVNTCVPLAVSDLVRRAMAYRPSDRFPDAEALVRETSLLIQQLDPAGETGTDTARVSVAETMPVPPPVPPLPARVPEQEPAKSVAVRPVSEDDDAPPSRVLPWLAGAAALVVLLTTGLVLNALFGGWDGRGQQAAAPAADEDRREPDPPAEVPAVPPVDTREMVLIPRGEARLGNSADELRAHLATIELFQANPSLVEAAIQYGALGGEMVTVEAFWIDKYEVTNAAYARFIAATGHSPPPHWGAAQPPAGKESLPVTHVSYDDTAAYARWAGKQLPTEIQWVRAFRGDASQFYPWGNTFDPSAANVIENRGFPRLAAVTATPRDVSPLGVFNLAGNAAEIVRDQPPIGGVRAVCIKGSDWRTQGSWRGVAAARLPFIASSTSEIPRQDEQIGFRCVYELPAR